jgi:exodeoxyribonuclease VII small subunit
MPESNSPEPSFENAMERLEQIVEQMESDKLPLETLLERYEEGTKLVRFCSEKLTAAEKRIEIITRNAAGKAEVTEFDPSSAPAATAATKAPKTKPAVQDDDISLF